jgi:hypothetical protein
MRTLTKLFTFLLCLELIVGPINPHLSLLGQSAHAGSCETGFEWNGTLNRCVTTAQAAEIMNATASCASDDTECYKTNAQNAFQDKVNKGEAPKRKENSQFMSTVGQAAAIAVPLAMAVGGMNNANSSCAAYSFYAMVAGSAALVIGDNLANFQHAKRLKKIKKSWGEIVNPEGAQGDKDKEREISIEAQSMAFEKLAEAEDSMVKAAKMKKNFFMIATLAYTVSAGIAIFEGIQEGWDYTAAAKNTCATASNYNNEKKSLYVEYSKGRSDEVFTLSRQFQYNIRSSNSLASFLTNQMASSLTHSSPSIETYEHFEKSLNSSSQEEIALFETFKTISIEVLAQLNPVPSAYAVEENANAETQVDGGAGGGNTEASGTANVESNAAKAYKEDESKGINWVGLGLGAAAGVAAGMMIGDKIVRPWQRAAFSGVLAGWTLIMANHAGSQAEASQKRADLLRQMKAEFASAAGAIYACKSEDRNDPSKPNCFCYTSENKRNPNRAGSPTCLKLWAGKDIKATNYLSGNDGNSKICINNQRKADPTCACKKTKSCMKVSINGLKGLNPGSFSMLSQSLDPLNKVASGSVDAANIDSAALENQAARTRKLVEKMENSKAAKDFKKKKDKLAKDIQKGMMKASAGISPNSILGSNSSGMPSNPGEAAKMLEKEVAASEAPQSINNNNTIAAPTQEKMPDLEFGLSEDQAALQEGQIAEVMQQDLDYGGNDINQGSTANIFEVLSSRYQRSGMRRLFDEKGTTQADKPAESDITQ